MPYNTYPYEIPPLPYAYDALEPYIDTETMRYHHDKHFASYANNLNYALRTYPTLQALTLRQLLSAAAPLPRGERQIILNNAGGVYNHFFYFSHLAPAGEGNHLPSGELAGLINSAYGSYEELKRKMSALAMNVFGSGWTVLALSENRNNIGIINLKDQDTVVPSGLTPVIMLDAWEHAYYLKHKNDRKAYIEAFWNVVSYPQT